MSRDVVIVHSSDLHVDHDYTARIHGGDGTAGLACVLAAAKSVGADVAVLVGDTFESHRLPQSVVGRTPTVIAAARLPVVLLPGNHDPAGPEGGDRRGLLAGAESPSGLRASHDEDR